jgi:hypothetical protein
MINSTAEVYPKVSLSAKHPELFVKFFPDTLEIPPNGLGISRIRVEATPYVPPDSPYTVQIEANITYPTQLTLGPLSAENFNLNQNETSNKTSKLARTAIPLLSAENFNLNQNETSNKTSKLARTAIPLLSAEKFDVDFMEAINKLYRLKPVSLSREVNRTDEVFRTLTVAVMPSITPQEHFVSFWTVWGPLIALIGGSFIAGLAGLVFKQRERK